MTKQSPTDKTSRPKSQKTLLIWLGIVLVVGALAFFGLTSYFANKAKEVASPLEKALVAAGATKLCETGDSGRGWDNKSPWYGAVFATSFDKEEAAKILQAIAEDEGYKLTYEQSPYSYIDWYVDEGSKKYEDSAFEDGAIRVSFNIYSGGDNLGCEGKNLDYDQLNAAIKLNLSLPSLK